MMSGMPPLRRRSSANSLSRMMLRAQLLFCAMRTTLLARCFASIPVNSSNFHFDYTSFSTPGGSTMASRIAVLLTGVSIAVCAFAQQPPPPLPPAVGNAVLLATNSIQVDRDCVVTRGDLVANNAGGGITVDLNFRLPAGFAMKADNVSIARGSTIDGDIFFNTLHNDGVSTGHLVTPLATPVISTLPSMIDRASGTQNVALANGEVRVVGTGDFGALTLGKDSTLRLPGGPYTFASINGGQGASMIFDGPEIGRASC